MSGLFKHWEVPTRRLVEQVRQSKYLIHTLPHTVIKSHRIWLFWKQIPVRFSNLTEFFIWNVFENWAVGHQSESWDLWHPISSLHIINISTRRFASTHPLPLPVCFCCCCMSFMAQFRCLKTGYAIFSSLILYFLSCYKTLATLCAYAYDQL